MPKNSSIEPTNQISPFLKWAGGKRWLTASHFAIFPSEFERYFEPFLGSGAVFFKLQPKFALLADSNEELIDTYKAIKCNYRLVIRYLKEHQRFHCDEYYYSVRMSCPRSLYQRAARFIYLNRTCWNALYRVNLSGQFNVPRGTKNSVILETDDFEQVSKQLSHVELACSDFGPIIDSAESNDFIFVDPPYSVKHNLNGFVKYNKKLFAWDDQVRLKDALVGAHERGVKFLMTNANHASIRSLYGSYFKTIVLSRQSVIAADSAKRDKTTELMIFNY
jgi:DNA adenine methylase